MVPVVLVFLLVLEVPGPEIRILQEISSPEPAGNVREVCRKHFHLVAPPKTSVVTSYDQKTTGTTKTHSGGSDGTGGSGVPGGFPGPWP